MLSRLIANTLPRTCGGMPSTGVSFVRPWAVEHFGLAATSLANCTRRSSSRFRLPWAWWTRSVSFDDLVEVLVAVALRRREFRPADLRLLWSACRDSAARRQCGHGHLVFFTQAFDVAWPARRAVCSSVRSVSNLAMASRFAIASLSISACSLVFSSVTFCDFLLHGVALSRWRPGPPSSSSDACRKRPRRTT